jgi:zinc transport system ATP-binding protein
LEKNNVKDLDMDKQVDIKIENITDKENDNKRFHDKQDCAHECCSLCCTKISSLDVQIGGNVILKNLNLHIHCGEFTAIIGPNGAGKSTLLKAILGEIRYTGNFEFVKANGDTTRKPIIGYVPQTIRFDVGSPVSVLDLFVSCITKYPIWFPIPKKIVKRVENILKTVNVEHLIYKRIGVLSGGELQRVLLALALEPVPELLLLDEPVSGIDVKGMEVFYSVVNSIRKKYDLSVVMVSHDMPLVGRYADRAVLINKELIKVGTPKEVFKSNEYKKIFRLNDDTMNLKNYYKDDKQTGANNIGGDA